MLQRATLVQRHMSAKLDLKRSDSCCLVRDFAVHIYVREPRSLDRECDQQSYQ